MAKFTHPGIPDIPTNTHSTHKISISMWIFDPESSKKPKKKKLDVNLNKFKWSERPAHYATHTDSERTLCGRVRENMDNVYYEIDGFLKITPGSDDRPRCKNCMKVYGRGAATGKTTGIL